ncbi:integral membrane protein [Stutzerimonas stutzeri TS44]|nr:integral membrane protein [Stutzerimonas stutzeri TS44]
MLKHKRIGTLVALTALLAGIATAQAQPPHDGKPGRGDKANKNHAPRYDQDYRRHGPSVDIGDVRITLRSHRDLLAPVSALPPGIERNLSRGKPLPPGIARKMDGRLLSHMPYYPGYEWRQVGRDVVLVAIATGIVYEILDNVFD